MATSGIDSNTASAILTAMNGGSAVTFTTPLKVLFLSAVRTADNGTDTEWSTSGGYTAGTGFSGLTFAAASTGSTGATQSSNVAATITNAPAQTWAGNKIKDSSGTPKETFWAALASSKTVNSGDTVTVPSGSLTTTLG